MRPRGRVRRVNNLILCFNMKLRQKERRIGKWHRRLYAIAMTFSQQTYKRRAYIKGRGGRNKRKKKTFKREAGRGCDIKLTANVRTLLLLLRLGADWINNIT